MKTTKRLLLTMIITVLTGICLSGCSRFDSTGYIQSMLDSLYKDDHAAYSDITHLSEETLKENYEEGINAEIEKLMSYMNISDSSTYVNENTRENARALFKHIYQYANYTVGQTDKKGNITITIAPICLFEPSKEELEAYVNDFFSRNEAGEFADYSDEQFYSDYIQGVIDILSKYTEQITYGEPKVVTVRVKSNSQNVYAISDTEFLSIDQFILDYIH